MSGARKMSARPPDFSIIMANYNNGHFITTAVQSVLAQTHRAWELIIVDDSSTDNSINIIESLAAKDRRIRLMQNHQNRGVGYTKHRAVEESRGAIVAILDPDDALTENALAVMWKAHSENPSASLCWSEHSVCDERLTEIEKSSSKFRGDSQMGCLSSQPGDIHALWSFKRDAYNRTQGFDTKLPLAEDKDLFYKLEEVGATYHVDETLYFYRQHSGSVSIGDRVANAYAYHLIVMCAALKRREPLLTQHSWEQQRQVIWKRYENFVYWGVTEIDLVLAAKLQRSISSDLQLGWAKSTFGKALYFRLRKTLRLF